MSSSDEKNERLKRDPDNEVWSNWQGAVLLKNWILRYCKLTPPLIEDMEEEFLEPAGYSLRMGSHCRVEGEDVLLSEDRPLLTIPPSGVAIISTFERVNIPGYLIARWNLKVKKVYQGLVWTGSLQVDPGYSGRLFCPVFNLSRDNVRLEFRKPIFMIDFVRTTRFEDHDCELWKSKDGRSTDSLGSLDTLGVKSALLGELEQKGKLIADMAVRLDRFQVAVFAILAIVITAVAILASLRFFGQVAAVSWQGWACFAISVSALVASIVALSFWWTSRGKNTYIQRLGEAILKRIQGKDPM